MRACQRRRGVSELTGVLLMLAVVVSLGVLIFVSADDGLHSLSEGYAAGMAGRGDAVDEKFKVLQAAFTLPGSLSSDGTSTNQASGTSSSISTTLSTADADDLVVAYVSPEDAGSGAPPSVSSISGGGLTWNFRVATPTETYTEYYVPITLTNGQATATPTSFQQMVTWDPASFATYEASNLGNIRFCADTLCVTPLNAWLESCTTSCTTGATTAVAWVNLGSNTIAAHGTLTVYMVFKATTVNFDGVYWGEAPQLSPTYAEYDNGASVFAAYFDGDTATADFTVYTGLTLAQATGVTGPGATTINAIEITGATAAHDPSFSFNQPLSNTGLILETSFALAADNNDATGVSGLVNSATATSVNDAVTYGQADGSDYFYQGTDIGGTVNIPINGAGASPADGTWLYGSETYTGSTETSFYAQITPALYGTPGQTAATGYSGTDTVANPLNTATHLYMGSIGGLAAVNIEYNFMRARDYPPSGVMPTMSVGAATSTTATFDVEEWYAVSSSALSSATMTATLSAPDTAATWIAVFGINGANTINPFDPNVSLPATSSGATPSTTISTTDSDDLLLYACAAGAGSEATGFTTIYSDTYPTPQNEYVGYQAVPSAQSGLAASCGTNAYGAEITDAVIVSSGADVYVQNYGTVTTTLVSVYVTDVTADSFVTRAAISVTVDVGSFAEIPHNSVAFDPTAGHTYSFTVTSSLGNSVVYEEEAE